jgi:hypothetical protein
MMAAPPPLPTEPPPESVVPAAGVRNATPVAALKIEKVIPLLHAPDDPGPDGEPQTEPIANPSPPSSNGWDRLLRGLFK